MPLWLAPVQAVVMPITEKHAEYAQKIYDFLRSKSVRCNMDNRNDKIGYRIRQAQLQKIPFMIILGDQEVENGTITVRMRNGENLTGIALNQFLEGQEWTKEII